MRITTVRHDVATTGARDVAAAHDALLADKSVQFGLPPSPPPPEIPEWVKAIGRFFDWIGGPIGRFFRWIDSFMPDIPVVKAMLWALLVVAAVALIYLLYTRLRGGSWRLPWAKRDGGAELATEEEWAPDAAAARDWLAEAEALAAQGRFDEAVHHLLFRSVDDIARRRPALVRPSVTSRELAAAGEVPANARGLFGTIAAIVERGLFARRDIDEPDWIEARDAYAKFALAGAWKA